MKNKMISAGLMIGFFMTMVPFRVVLTLAYTFPKMCCSYDNVRVYVTIVKGTIIIVPAICFATSKQMRKAFKVC